MDRTSLSESRRMVAILSFTSLSLMFVFVPKEGARDPLGANGCR
jgi:hypothetical protein